MFYVMNPFNYVYQEAKNDLPSKSVKRWGSLPLVSSPPPVFVWALKS